MQTHVMLDLETLSLRSDAVILQIAAVEFEPRKSGAILADSALNLYVNPRTQLDRHIDESTLRFWSEQTLKGVRVLEEAQGPHAVGLIDALEQLRLWYNPGRPDPDEERRVWAHGTWFDIALVRHAFMTRGWHDCPWHYRRVMDTKTFYYAAESRRHFTAMRRPVTRESAEHDVTMLLGKACLEHDAFHDCLVQIIQLQSVM